MNSNKLYVGGLPYSVTDDKLQEIFSPHGTVESARVITDRMTGRSRGFGFVEMSSQSEAEEAIQKMNGTDLEGRSLTVNEAKPQQERSVAAAEAAAALAAAAAADATAGNLKISTKKRRQVGSPLLVLFEPFHIFPSSVL